MATGVIIILGAALLAVLMVWLLSWSFKDKL
jgi:hypothetical protein